MDPTTLHAKRAREADAEAVASLFERCSPFVCGAVLLLAEVLSASALYAGARGSLHATLLLSALVANGAAVYGGLVWTGVASCSLLTVRVCCSRILDCMIERLRRGVEVLRG